MNWPQAFCYVGVVGAILMCIAYMWRVFCEMLKMETMSEVRNTITGLKRPDDCPPPPKKKKFRLNPPDPWPGPPKHMWECKIPVWQQRSAPLAKETNYHFLRKFTKAEWLLICIDLCANGYPKFGNWLWMEMNASVGDKASCFFSQEEVRRVDAAVKRAGIMQEEELINVDL